MNPKVIRTFVVLGRHHNEKYRVVRNSIGKPVLERFSGVNTMHDENWELVSVSAPPEGVVKELLKIIMDTSVVLEAYANKAEEVQESIPEEAWIPE